MRIVVPVSDVMFLIRMVDRNLAMFGLPVTYVFTGPPDQAARIRSVVGDERLVASHAEEFWPVLWERQLRDANEVGDVWLLESDLFFGSRRWFDRLLAARPAFDVIGAYRRRGGFAPHCLWLRQGVLARHPDVSILPRTVGGVFYDMMDSVTKRMVDTGDRWRHLPPTGMHHMLGVSVAKQELSRPSRTIESIASRYDLKTVRYIAESIHRYRAMLERWGEDDDFWPTEAEYRSVMRAIAARGVDTERVAESLRDVQPLERLFPPQRATSVVRAMVERPRAPGLPRHHSRDRGARG